MNPKSIIHDSWKPLLPLLDQEELKYLNNEVLANCSYQPQNKMDIFRVFQMPLQDIKVVVLGHDPYPMPQDSNGLAIALSPTAIAPKEPLTLKYVKEEVSRDTGKDIYYIEPLEWVSQGVFMLNAALTVETGMGGSHLKYWRRFTEQVVSFIARKNPCVWLLWGQQAQSFIPKIGNSSFHVKGYDSNTIQSIPASPDYNYLLTATHPVSEGYHNGGGFKGCSHFTMANTILKRKHLITINW